MKKQFTFLFIFLPFFVYSQIAFYDALTLASLESNEKAGTAAYGLIANGRDTTIRYSSTLDFILKQDSMRQSGRFEVPSWGYLALKREERQQIKNLQSFFLTPFSQNIQPLDFTVLNPLLVSIDSFIHHAATAPEASGFTGGILAGLSLVPTMVSLFENSDAQTLSRSLDGLTKYIAESFKAGVTNTYISFFEQHLDKIGEMRLLFPETYNLIKKRDPLAFPDFGTDFKVCFEKDVQLMARHLCDYIEDPVVFRKINGLETANFPIFTDQVIESVQRAPSFSALRISLDLTDQIAHDVHPVNILLYLEQRYRSDANFYPVIHGLNLMQSALRDKTKAINGQTDNVWLGLEQLREMNTEKEWRYFAGLLYQQDRNFFSDLAGRSDMELEQFLKAKIQPVIKILLELQEFARETKDRDYRKYMQLSIELVKAGYEIQSNKNPQFLTFIESASDLVDISSAMETRNYGDVIVKFSDLFRNILIQANPAGNWQTSPALTRFLGGFNRFGQFSVGMLNAEDSDDMKAVIQQFADNPRTYSDKRKTLWGVSINSYPGLHTGFMRLETTDKGSFYVGPSLPLGIELYWSKRRKAANNERYDVFVQKEKIQQLTGKNFGVLFQVIDLGALFSFRLANSEAELPDAIDFEDVFSPGILFNWGIFRHNPINLGFGYQYGAQLRKVTIDNFEKQPNSHQILLKLTWDIPLLNLYNLRVEGVNAR